MVICFDDLNAQELARAGIEFDTPAETKLFIDIIQEELEVRVGRAIAKGKTQAQMAEFSRCNDHAAETWLQRNCPNYKQIVLSVKHEFDSELRQYRNQIPGAHLPAMPFKKDTPLNSTWLSDVTCTCLQKAGLRTIADVADVKDLYEVTNLSREGRREVRELLTHIASAGGAHEY